MGITWKLKWRPKYRHCQSFFTYFFTRFFSVRQLHADSIHITIEFSYQLFHATECIGLKLFVFELAKWTKVLSMLSKLVTSEVADPKGRVKADHRQEVEKHTCVEQSKAQVNESKYEDLEILAAI